MSNVNCSISGLPIYKDNPIYALPIYRNETQYKGYYDSWKLYSLPIKGSLDEYIQFTPNVSKNNNEFEKYHGSSISTLVEKCLSINIPLYGIMFFHKDAYEHFVSDLDCDYKHQMTYASKLLTKNKRELSIYLDCNIEYFIVKLKPQFFNPNEFTLSPLDKQLDNADDLTEFVDLILLKSRLFYLFKGLEPNDNAINDTNISLQLNVLENALKIANKIKPKYV